MSEDNKKAKINGFSRAFIIAIVSFFVIFFFFPQAAEMHFGVSAKSSGIYEGAKEKVQKEADKAVSEIVDNVNTLSENAIKQLIAP